MDVSQGSSATPLRCGGIVNADFVAYLLVNPSVKKIENRSTFGEVMDNIVVPCFFTHSVVSSTVARKSESTQIPSATEQQPKQGEETLDFR